MLCCVSQVLEGLSADQLRQWLAAVNAAASKHKVRLMLWTTRSLEELVQQLKQLVQQGLVTMPIALITEAGATVGGA